MDPELLKYIGSLGVGGVIALCIFLIYRQDHERVVKLSAECEQRFDLLAQVLQKNSVSNEALSQTIAAMITHQQAFAVQQSSDFRLLMDRLLDNLPEGGRRGTQTRS